MIKKKRYSSFRIVFMILIILQFILVEFAIACSCMSPESPQIEYSKFDAIFVGKVVQIIKRTSEYGYSVKLKVLDKYKGNLDSIIVVYTGFGAGDCGYNFKENEEYFIYAYTSLAYTGLGVNVCSRTRLLSESKEDIEALKDKLIKSK